MGATEWFVTLVGSFIFAQFYSLGEYFFTMGAAKWFISGVSLLAQFCCFDKTLFTMGATEWFVTLVGSFIFAQFYSLG